MTTYSLPSITPTEVSLGIISNTRSFTSPFSGAVQTVQRAGERLKLRMVFRNRNDSERQELIAFLAKLNGMEHRFTVRDYGHTQRGTFGGTPLVKGAGQAGASLLIDGCSLTVTNWIRAGDQFQVGNELKIVTADLNSNGAGEVTLAFRPALRSSPADNAAITTTTPAGLWMLTQDTIDWATGAGPAFSDFVVDAVEDVLG